MVAVSIMIYLGKSSKNRIKSNILNKKTKREHILNNNNNNNKREHRKK